MLDRVYYQVLFKFLLKDGVEESIVNAPLVSLQSKNTNNATSEVRFKQLIRNAFTIDSSTPTSRRNLNEHPILFNVKLKHESPIMSLRALSALAFQIARDLCDTLFESLPIFDLDFSNPSMWFKK
jgi:hypothetical protein